MAKRAEPLNPARTRVGRGAISPGPGGSNTSDPSTNGSSTSGPRPERQVAFALGISAESRAAAYLIAKGYRILARRWRSPAGEIDIVARRKHVLVFVEVKARETIDGAAESVIMRQRKRIAAAAELWLAKNPDPSLTDIRFDAVLVAPKRMPVHIPAAFDLD